MDFKSCLLQIVLKQYVMYTVTFTFQICVKRINQMRPYSSKLKGIYIAIVAIIIADLREFRITNLF